MKLYQNNCVSKAIYSKSETKDKLVQQLQQKSQHKEVLYTMHSYLKEGSLNNGGQHILQLNLSSEYFDVED